MVGGWEAEAYYFLGHHTSVNDTDDETTGRRGDGGICAKFATGRSLRVRRESRDATTRLTVYSVHTNPKTRLRESGIRRPVQGFVWSHDRLPLCCCTVITHPYRRQTLRTDPPALSPQPCPPAPVNLLKPRPVQHRLSAPPTSAESVSLRSFLVVTNPLHRPPSGKDFMPRNKQKTRQPPRLPPPKIKSNKLKGSLASGVK